MRAAKKHQIEIKYLGVMMRVMMHEVKIIIPKICIRLTLDTSVETTVGMK